MTGVVIDLASWYVPTVLNCKERLVKTTNPQKEAASGTTFNTSSLFGENTPNQLQHSRHRDVIAK